MDSSLAQNPEERLNALAPRDPFELDLRKVELPKVALGDRDVVRLSEALDGKHIALVLTGSIASYEGPRIVRMLRRYGASVSAYVTDEGQKMVTPTALQWAAGPDGRVISGSLSGNVEHLGREDGTRYDGYLVCPATYDTINKLANGTADSPAMALLAAARGRMEKDGVPLLIAPTMNGDMVNSRLIESLTELKRCGAYILKPRMESGKFELPDTETIAVSMARQLADGPLKGEPILLTAGPTPVRLDKVRIIANIFKGTLGVEIARELITKGAEVRLLLGGSSSFLPKFVQPYTKTHSDFDEYLANVRDEVANGYRLKGVEGSHEYTSSIFSAAVADYRPAEMYQGKISSGKSELSLPPFVQTTKVIKDVREAKPNLPMITFKLLVDVSEEALLEEAQRRLKDYQMIVANRLEDMEKGSKRHSGWLVHRDGIEKIDGTKTELARAIVGWLEGFSRTNAKRD